MALPEHFMAELKSRVDIVDVVSDRVPLKRKGRAFFGLCPFHSERTPSFAVYPENGSFYCFGCGAGGDIITFVEKSENLHYIDAVHLLAKKAGLDAPKEDAKASGFTVSRRRIFEANRAAAKFFFKSLKGTVGQKARNYLRSRGVSEKTARKFGIGFAPTVAESHFVRDLLAEGFAEKELLDANLVMFSRTGRLIPRFFGRLMFPIIDLSGNVVAFGGRTMTDAQPKYLNSGDTAVFRKSAHLFGLSFAHRDKAEDLLLVEGYMDVVALHQAGFTNAVAALGTALTHEQARLLARYAQEVVLCYDSDAAGQRAISRAIELLRGQGLRVKVLNLPNAKDPDEFLRGGENTALKFKKLLEASSGDVEYLLHKTFLNFDVKRADGKAAYLKEASKILARLHSKIEREIYTGRLADDMQISRETLFEQVEKIARSFRRSQEKSEIREVEKKFLQSKEQGPHKERPHAAMVEDALIAFVIKNPSHAHTIFSGLPQSKFCTEFGAKMCEILEKRTREGKDISISALRKYLNDEETSKVARLLAQEETRSSDLGCAKEYMRVILHEKEKLTEDNICAADDNDIREYMKKLREFKG